jgi:hypothetical protein
MNSLSPHPFHWDDLDNRPRASILGQPGVSEAPNSSGYMVKFLNEEYLVDSRNRRITEISPEPDRNLTEAFQILLMKYLVADHGGRLDGTDVSEKDLPGGLTYFQGPHALKLSPIARLYGDNPQAFEARGLEFNAGPAQFGDISMKFLPFPNIPVTYVLWRADEEFPASASVVFDKSITRWFELDMVFNLVLCLTARIVEGQ